MRAAGDGGSGADRLRLEQGAGSPPNPQLLRSLGRLARGLSALFWGIPVALIICMQTTRADWLRPLGLVPPVLATGLLWYALRLMGDFQRQERVWQVALDRAKALALILFLLSPFFYWWGRIPGNAFYTAILDVLMVNGLILLYALNPVLRRLVAMLPDETLRHETRAFTSVNAVLLLVAIVMTAAIFLLNRLSPEWHQQGFGVLTNLLPSSLSQSLPGVLDRLTIWLGLLFVLVPVSTTMALLWKTKEVILDSVFGTER